MSVVLARLCSVNDRWTPGGVAFWRDGNRTGGRNVIAFVDQIDDAARFDTIEEALAEKRINPWANRIYSVRVEPCPCNDPECLGRGSIEPGPEVWPTPDIIVAISGVA